MAPPQGGSRTLQPAGSRHQPAVHLRAPGHTSRMRVVEAPILTPRLVPAATSRRRALSRCRIFCLVLHVLLLLILMQNSAFAAAFHSPSGSAGLPLASGVARGANAPAVDAENSLKPVNSIPRSTTNVVQAIKGTPADPGQKGAPAHISSSADAQEGRDGRTVKGKVAGESPAVPPGLVADSNISIRRP